MYGEGNRHGSYISCWGSTVQFRAVLYYACGMRDMVRAGVADNGLVPKRDSCSAGPGGVV